MNEKQFMELRDFIDDDYRRKMDALNVLFPEFSRVGRPRTKQPVEFGDPAGKKPEPVFKAAVCEMCHKTKLREGRSKPCPSCSKKVCGKCKAPNGDCKECFLAGEK